MTKAVQTSLFKPKKRKNPITLNPVQQIYQIIKQHHLALKLQLFEGGAPCQSVSLDYVNNLSGTDCNYGEDVELVCKRANQTKPKHIYHYVNHHFLEYSPWLLKMVLQTELKKRTDKLSLHKSNAS